MTKTDSIIRALTYRDEKNGATITWNGLNVLGSHLDISYGFLSKLPSYYSPTPNYPDGTLGDTQDFIAASKEKSVVISEFNGSLPDSQGNGGSGQKLATIQAINAWASVANITFTREDSNPESAAITFGNVGCN